MELLAKTRQDAIYRILQKESAVTASSLAASFHVSAETIRKDLLALENAHLLVRVHGGAVPIGGAKPLLPLSARLCDNQDKKQSLARLAASFVRENDTVAIDAGSTAIEFAMVLRQTFHTLTVVTACMDVFETVRDTGFTVFLCGGCFLPSENMFCGDFPCRMLSQLHVDKTFMCPTAVSLQNGLCDYHPQIVEVQKKLLSAGNKVFVLADSSKYEKNALIKLDDMRPAYTYISDAALPVGIRKLYRDNGLRIITSPEDIVEIQAKK